MSVTICWKCKHLISTGHIWYDNTCNTAKPEPKRNFTTGRMDRPEKIYCRDRNDGNCMYFEAK